MKQQFIKSIFLSCLFLLAICLITQAQTNVGVRAGVNLSNVHMESANGEQGDTRSLPGFNIGLTVDMPIAADFFLQPALLYSS